METKKYISPGGWFSLEYPCQCNEFEDEEGSFLFYNPEKWDGNFRISAFKDSSANYAESCMADELRSNPAPSQVTVGDWKCIYSKESFLEKGESYDSHFWITGKGNVSIECSFTVKAGGSKGWAEAVIASLVIRPDDGRQPKEVIPIRVLEINKVNESYDWAVSTIKKKLKKDFTSSKEDIASLQKTIDGGEFNTDRMESWISFGIAFGTILVNEMDGMEWVTVVDGKNEFPALRFGDTKVMVHSDFLWKKVQAGEKCNLQQEFERIRNEVEKVL